LVVGMRARGAADSAAEGPVQSSQRSPSEPETPPEATPGPTMAPAPVRDEGGESWYAAMKEAARLRRRDTSVVSHPLSRKGTPEKPIAPPCFTTAIEDLQKSKICNEFAAVCDLSGLVDHQACQELWRVCSQRPVLIKRHTARRQNPPPPGWAQHVAPMEPTAHSKSADDLREGRICRKIRPICGIEGVVDKEACASLHEVCLPDEVRAKRAQHLDEAGFVPYAPMPRNKLERAQARLAKHKICKNLELVCAAGDSDESEEVCANLRAACGENPS